MSIFIALNTACRRLIAQSAAAVAAVNEPLEHPCDRLVAAGAGSVHFFLLRESILHCLPELLGYDRLMLPVIHDYVLVIIFSLGSGAALLAPSDLAYIHGVIEHIFDKSVLGTGAAIGAHTSIAEAARYIHLTATGCIHRKHFPDYRGFLIRNKAIIFHAITKRRGCDRLAARRLFLHTALDLSGQTD